MSNEKINDTIRMHLSQKRDVAINNLTKLKIIDIATEFYDFYQSFIKQREAIQHLLIIFDQKYDQAEFEKICENDPQTMKERMKIWNDQQQSIKNQINPLNNSDNQSNNQLNDQQNYILIQKEKILFYEEQINEFQRNQTKMQSLNKQLLEIIEDKNNIQIQLQYQLQEKTNQMGINLFRKEIQFINLNSQKIDENCQQFSEIIDNINNKRDQIIRNMEEILTQIELNQSRNVIGQYQVNKYIDENEFQDIINKMLEVQGIMELMQKSLKQFQIELNLNLKKNENTQETKIITNLQQKLNGNLKCFNIISQILDEIIRMLIEIQEINVRQNQKNEQLDKQLKKLQIENNQIKEKLFALINQLKMNDQKENQLLTNQNNKQNCENCLEISNKYANLYNQFNDQIMLEIFSLSKVILIWFRNENRNPNIDPNSQLIKDIENFIIYIENQQLNNDNNNLELQQKKIMLLFKKIYPKISSNSIVNQYINKSFEKVQEIQKKIQEYKREFDKVNQEIENIQQNERINLRKDQ